MSYRIEFRNVGRGKKTWQCSVRELSHGSLIRALRKGRALMSRDISFMSPEHDEPGVVFAGLHAVGEWVILDFTAHRERTPASPGGSQTHAAPAPGGAGDSLGDP